MSLFGCTDAQHVIATRFLLEMIAEEYGKETVSNRIIIVEEKNRYRIVEDTFMNRHFQSVLDIHALEIQPEQLTRLVDFKLIHLQKALRRVGTEGQIKQVNNEDKRRHQELREKLESTVILQPDERIQELVSIKKTNLKPEKPSKVVAPTSEPAPKKKTLVHYHNVQVGHLTDMMKFEIERYITNTHPDRKYRLDEWGVFVILSKNQDKFYLYDNILMRTQELALHLSHQ